jgi:hypothetical protein
MADNEVFGRFVIGALIATDDVYSHARAIDKNTGEPVLVVRLREAWVENLVLLGEIAASTLAFQKIVRRELAPVLEVSPIGAKEGGFVVVFGLPAGARLAEVGPALPLGRIIEGVAEALNHAHTRRDSPAFCAYLGRQQVWVANGQVLTVPLAYGPAIGHGWRAGSLVAPELLAGGLPDARADVYALARLAAELEPAAARLEPVRTALSGAPGQRPAKARDFASALGGALPAFPARPATSGNGSAGSPNPATRGPSKVRPVFRGSDLADGVGAVPTGPPDTTTPPFPRIPTGGTARVITVPPAFVTAPEVAIPQPPRSFPVKWALVGGGSLILLWLSYFIWQLRPPEFVHVPLLGSVEVLDREAKAFRETLAPRICSLVTEDALRGPLTPATRARTAKRIAEEKAALDQLRDSVGLPAVALSDDEVRNAIIQCEAALSDGADAPGRGIRR